ncbi:hypothetical protein NCS56_00370100 [Fusarium sp. Ph1]|nr:hypothetical protein NCS56_00370100 [Fusarium sp. Ph1]
METTDDKILDDLEITFNRFVAAPDDSSRNEMPPSIGLFPLFNAKDHAVKVAQKGDLVITMSQRQAMSVSFSSQKEYTIKIYSGSVNAISGELAVDPTEAPLHRLNLIQGGSFTQNYTLVPPQGSESQVTGHDTVGMLHFEISRLDLSPTESYESHLQGPRFAIKLHGLYFNMFFSAHDGTPVRYLVFTLRSVGCKYCDTRNLSYWILYYGKAFELNDTSL